MGAFKSNRSIGSNELIGLLPLPQSIKDSEDAYRRVIEYLWSQKDFHRKIEVPEGAKTQEMVAKGFVAYEAWFYSDTVNRLIREFATAYMATVLPRRISYGKMVKQ